jgi:hypothetical protein
VAKRTFGTVDELPSGRLRARYRGPDGRRHARVFSTKADAWAWLATQQTDLLRKTSRAPTATLRTVGEYAEDYFARNDLRASTRDLYAGLWRHHLAMTWADVPVDEVTPAAVRSWHAKAGRTTRPTALAQSYRLLRAILNVAVADEAIALKPVPAARRRDAQSRPPLSSAYCSGSAAAGRATGARQENRPLPRTGARPSLRRSPVR